ncbi:MAG: hypothetical protein A3F61_04265 [Candidatus Blackburnbacteria bacterium RIFCSPHIGHO2_12_FULL_41_13b]|uniref:Uncharacterized protein n=1 Tax=Candidatus Blackburnbacteria bacterium RIFCSPHIGHO2_12_FULL_41_13b TaxID=1797517 RepID=A0A1G1VAE3_9BACT|nr:MAG: hypothetical protein A3F61_04265 [Candidatus Blackburnbacteria bacterium RIFCSPHIGHO2_12_FULL_41_13b]
MFKDHLRSSQQEEATQEAMRRVEKEHYKQTLEKCRVSLESLALTTVPSLLNNFYQSDFPANIQDFEDTQEKLGVRVDAHIDIVACERGVTSEDLLAVKKMETNGKIHFRSTLVAPTIKSDQFRGKYGFYSYPWRELAELRNPCQGELGVHPDDVEEIMKVGGAFVLEVVLRFVWDVKTGTWINITTTDFNEFYVRIGECRGALYTVVDSTTRKQKLLFSQLRDGVSVGQTLFNAYQDSHFIKSVNPSTREFGYKGGR